jgi:glucose/arabinose dehydrogenase
MRFRTAAVLIAAAALVSTLGGTPAASAAPQPERALVATAPRTALPPVSRLRVSTSAVVGGLAEPLAMAPVADGRMFVVERRGTVRVVKNGRLLAGTYLDIRSRVGSAGGEQGLLGIAVDPRFRTSPRMWLVFTAKGTGDLVLATVRARFASAARADVSTLRTVLSVPHRGASNHNGGSIVFGNDGMLFWSTGDGGGGGDTFDNSRKGTSLLGKILRLDVHRNCATRRYCIPASNPRYRLHRTDLLGPIWAKGLRNPWRTSVDPLTGDLWIGDVGQDKYEEIDRIAPGAGGLDFGWPCREGFHSYDPGRCAGRTMTPPLWEECHPDGVPGCSQARAGEALIGGIVYRGRSQPALYGSYLFADYVTGNIWVYRAGTSATVGNLSGLSWIGRSWTGEPLGLTLGGQLVRFAARTA